ncbi:MAG: 16S rRNA (guanine(966)-N(2))-methyltransferase RsmD [Candidatus Nanoperiomorbaceae bacterium]
MAKLRIISGKFGGRLIDATDNSATHPMGDRVRSALFSKIGSRMSMNGLRILDAFAGTGAIGIEALSRGAKSATFVERDHEAQTVLTKNVIQLGLEDQTTIIKSDVKRWLLHKLPLLDVDKFDIIFCDPPYDKPQWDIIDGLIKTCTTNGLVVISYRSGETLPNPKGVVVVDKSSYGEASLVFCRRVDD